MNSYRFRRALHQVARPPKYSPEQLMTWAEEINQKAFGGKLTLDFPITQDLRSTNAWGMLYFAALKVTKIRLNSLYDLPELQARSTLAHELCHVAQIQLNGGYARGGAHGPSFDAYRKQCLDAGVPCSKSDNIENVRLADESKLKGKTTAILVAKAPYHTVFNCKKADVGTIVRFALQIAWNGAQEVHIVSTGDPVALSTSPTLVKGVPLKGNSLDAATYERIKADSVFLIKRSDLTDTSQEDAKRYVDELDAAVRGAKSETLSSGARRRLTSGLTLWHGSSAEEPIEQFRPGTWLSESDEFAEGYAQNFGSGITEEVEVEPRNTFRLVEDNIVDVLQQAGYDERTLERARGQGLGYGLGNLIHNEPSLLLKWAQAKGIDLLEFRDADVTNQLYADAYLLVDPSIVRSIQTHGYVPPKPKSPHGNRYD